MSFARWRSWTPGPDGKFRPASPYAPPARSPRAPRPERRHKRLNDPLTLIPAGAYRDHRAAHGCWPGPCPERERLWKESKDGVAP